MSPVQPYDWTGLHIKFPIVLLNHLLIQASILYICINFSSIIVLYNSISYSIITIWHYTLLTHHKSDHFQKTNNIKTYSGSSPFFNALCLSCCFWRSLSSLSWNKLIIWKCIFFTDTDGNNFRVKLLPSIYFKPILLFYLVK